MYADKITDSMRRTIDETERRRDKQRSYNTQHNIEPTQIRRARHAAMTSTPGGRKGVVYDLEAGTKSTMVADAVVEYMNAKELENAISQARQMMETAARELDFMSAARYRDEMYVLQERLKTKK